MSTSTSTIRKSPFVRQLSRRILLSPLHACFVEIATAKSGAQITNLMFVKSYSYSFSCNRFDDPLYF